MTAHDIRSAVVWAVIDRPYRTDAGDCRCLAVLVVVFLSIDVVAGVMQFSVQPLAFSHGELSIRAGKPLIDSNACLLRFQAPGLGTSQFTAPDALMDSLLFPMLDFVNRLSSSQRRRCAHS